MFIVQVRAREYSNEYRFDNIHTAKTSAKSHHEQEITIADHLSEDCNVRIYDSCENLVAETTADYRGVVGMRCYH